MGLAQVRVDAVASASALQNQGRKASVSDVDAYAGGVGDAPAGLLVTADGALGLADSTGGQGLALPASQSRRLLQPRSVLLSSPAHAALVGRSGLGGRDRGLHVGVVS